LKVRCWLYSKGLLFIRFSVETKRNLRLDVLRTVHSTSRADKNGCTIRDWAVAPFGSSFRQVEEGKRILYLMASRNSRLRKEQTYVGARYEDWTSMMIADAIRSIVIEDAMRAFHAGQSPPPVFFYCSRNIAEPGRSSPEAIIASIARQLSSLRPGFPLLDSAITTYLKKEAEGFASGPLRINESCALIIQLVEHYPLTTIVIDALDECDPERRANLLETLETILQESSHLVKIFVSSRDDQDIVCHLKYYPNLEIVSSRNMYDIVSFVESETRALITKKKLLRFSSKKEELEKVIIDQVTKGASGMYVVVPLHFVCLQ